MKKYEFQIFTQCEGYHNFEKAQDAGWEIAGEAKAGWTSSAKHTKMLFLPMKRELK